MKMVTRMLCIVFLSFLLIGCHTSQEPDNTQDRVHSEDHDMLTDTEYALDVEYTEAVRGCNSNVELSDVNSLYAQKWYDLAENYYTRIIEAEFFYNEDEIKIL